MSRAVIDQPGFRVTALGLLLSCLLGMVLQNQVSPSKVEKSLQKSVQILEKDFSIDFEKAEVRLSKWGLPLPYLLVSKIRVSPKKADCQNSQIYIDELELPLGFRNIFNPQKIISQIRAHQVEIRLAENLDPCLSGKAAVEPPASAPAPTSLPAMGSASSSALFSKSTKTQLKEISIDQLKVISQKNFEQPLVFKQLRIGFDYQQELLSQIDLSSKFYAIKDQRADIYFLIADMTASLKPDPVEEMQLELEMKGRLLDGDIRLSANGGKKSQKLAYQLETKKVSLKAFSPLLTQMTPPARQGFERWPLSISFVVQGEGRAGQPRQAYLKFISFQALGDNTSVEASPIEIETDGKQTKVKPFQLEIKRLSLAPLKAFLSDQVDLRSVESLGYLSGKYRFEGDDLWNFLGDVSRTEVIFSNRGSRELQGIDRADFQIRRRKNLYDFKLNGFQMNEVSVPGELQGDFDVDQKAIQFKMNVEGPLLNDRVWKQLTTVSQNPLIKLSWTYKKAAEERQQLKLSSPQLQFQGFDLSDVQVDFVQLMNDGARSLAVSLKSAKSQFRVADMRPSVTRNFFNLQTGLQESEYTAVKTQMNLRGLDWKNIHFEFETGLLESGGTKVVEKVKAEGEWKANNSLTGHAQIQNSKRTLRFNILKTAQDEVDFTPAVPESTH